MKPSTIISLAALSTIGLVAWGWNHSAPVPAAGPGDCCAEPNTSPAPVCCEARFDQTDASIVASKHVLTLEGANKVLAAAMDKARERQAGGAIAVVDDAGNVIALQRIDGTFGAGSTVSIGKARTAALFKKPTKAFEDSINGGRIALAAVQEMTPLQGGVPIMHDGYVVGAIGVSGAHSQLEDEEIALAGAAAISSSASAANHEQR